jgi:hypothetical protein
MKKPGSGVASGREKRDCYQCNDDESIFLAHWLGLPIGY